MKRLAIIAAASLVATPALAALASPYQRAAELSAVIEVALPVLGIRTIEQISFIATDEYQVLSISCRLTVKIEDLAQDGGPVSIGPRQFEAVAGDMECEQ